MKSSLHRKLVIFLFLSIPFLSSLYSTIHIVSLFDLGNPTWMSIGLAIAFEIGSIASLMSFSVLDKIKKAPIYFIFGVLFLMQLIGNVYFSFDYVTIKMLTQPDWLMTFRELLGFIIGDSPDNPLTKFVLSLIIGVPIPLVSICLTKSLVDYLESDKKEVKPTPIQEFLMKEPANVTEELFGKQEKETPLEEEKLEEVKINNTKEVEEEKPVEEKKEEGGLSVAVFPNNKN